MDDRKLVGLVAQHPEIYDIYGENFTNKTLKELAWSLISKEMGMTVIACKAKWTILRNSYIRYLRQKVKWKNKTRNKKKWHLADEMAFMRDYVKLQTRAELDSMIPSDTTNEDFVTQHPYTELRTSPVCIQSQASDNDRRVNELTADNIVDLLKARSTAGNISNNPHMSFFNSLIPDIERLSARRQRKFKEQVMSLLNNFLDEEESEVVSTSFAKYS